ncbi:MAG: hypothetical protein K0Q97_893 [Bacillota bacterium]|jgi:hypothetical protein|nr:hypothetical protein [Bacillota bacterium]
MKQIIFGRGFLPNIIFYKIKLKVNMRGKINGDYSRY